MRSVAQALSIWGHRFQALLAVISYNSKHFQIGKEKPRNPVNLFVKKSPHWTASTGWSIPIPIRGILGARIGWSPLSRATLRSDRSERHFRKKCSSFIKTSSLIFTIFTMCSNFLQASLNANRSPKSRWPKIFRCKFKGSCSILRILIFWRLVAL